MILNSPCFQASFGAFFHLGILYSRHFPNYLSASLSQARPQCEFCSQIAFVPTWSYRGPSPISRSNENLPTMNRYRQDLSRRDNIRTNEEFRHFTTCLTYLPFALAYSQTRPSSNCLLSLRCRRLHAATLRIRLALMS